LTFLFRKIETTGEIEIITIEVQESGIKRFRRRVEREEKGQKKMKRRKMIQS